MIDKDPIILIMHQDVCNKQKWLCIIELDGLTPTQAMLRALDEYNLEGPEHQYLYFCHKTNDHLDFLMWFHPTSISFWKAHYNLLLADCTYATNKYNLLLCHVMGWTNMGQTFDVAFAIISGEKEQNYKMVVECMATVFRDHCGGIKPNVIVIDKE